MLNDQQRTVLDKMWDELLYVSHEPLKYEVAFEQIREFATQDRPDLVKEWTPLVEGVTVRYEDARARRDARAGLFRASANGDQFRFGSPLLQHGYRFLPFVFRGESIAW